MIGVIEHIPIRLTVESVHTMVIGGNMYCNRWDLPPTHGPGAGRLEVSSACSSKWLRGGSQ